MRQAVAANTPSAFFSFRNAPPPPQASAGGGDETQDPSGSNSRAGEVPTAAATTLPARLDSLKWTIGRPGFAAIFALGLIFLMRRGLRWSPEAGVDFVPANWSPQNAAGPRTSDAGCWEVNQKSWQPG